MELLGFESISERLSAEIAFGGLTAIFSKPGSLQR